MCARYEISQELDNDLLARIIDAFQRKNNASRARTAGEVFPTDTVPVIATGRTGKPDVFAMDWGYPMSSGSLVINARSETAEDKPLFRQSAAARRCVIPASWYYEWNPNRVKHRIRPAGASAIWLAGLYRLTDGLPQFVVLTQKPGEQLSAIHDRMPVLLPRELIADWVNADYRAGELLRHAIPDAEAIPAEAMQLSFDLNG